MSKHHIFALTVGLLTPAIAFAQIGVGDPAGSTGDQVRATLTGMGYDIIALEIDGDEIEAEARLNGIAYEIEVSAQRGIVTGIELEDNDV
jgi:hypothetical protein